MASVATYQVLIDLPRQQAWEMMQDLTCPQKYVPGLLQCEMHGAQRQGVGTSRRVFKRFVVLDETVTAWEEGYGFTLRLHDGAKDKPLPRSYFIYAMDDAPNQQTLFTATMGYEFPLGALGALIDRFLVLPIVQAEIRDVALAVKYFYENKSTPTKSDLKALRQQGF